MNWRNISSADIDECALGEHNCNKSATCSDVVGGEDSFNCTCNTGYTVDGVSCVGEYSYDIVLSLHYLPLHPYWPISICTSINSLLECHLRTAKSIHYYVVTILTK